MGSSSSAPVEVRASDDAIEDEHQHHSTNDHDDLTSLGALVKGDLRPPDADTQRNANNRKRFVAEDRVLSFNWTTFWEEFVCQTAAQKCSPL